MRGLALGLFLAVCGVCCAGEKPASGGNEPILRTSIDWLANALPGDDEAAAMYAGRTLVIEGWVEEMGRDAGGWYVTLRWRSARPTQTRCYFPPGGGEQLDHLYRGATAELMGDCEGYDEKADAVVLRNCRLIIADFG